MGTVTKITDRLSLPEQCPVCGSEHVKCYADPPGSWNISRVVCARCGLPIVVDAEDED
jgi:transcription elongation factor Elf1